MYNNQRNYKINQMDGKQMYSIYLIMMMFIIKENIRYKNFKFIRL